MSGAPSPRDWGQRDPGAPPRTAHVIVSSTRAAAGAYPDKSGPAAVEALRAAGLRVGEPEVVADGEPLRAALHRVLVDAPLDRRPDLLITSGGTGVMADDLTPELTAPLLERTLPGIQHALWAEGLEHVPTAVLSRGLVGVRGRTLVVNLPGSRGGVKDGLRVILPLLEHVLHQLEGDREQGHAAPGGASSSSVADAPAAPEGGFQPSGVQGDHPADRRSSEVLLAEVTERPLDPQAVQALVASPHTGAVVGFSGIVRDHDAGRGVTRLDYTAHPSAQDVLEQVCAEVAVETPGLRLAAAHRIGALQVGESALEVAVAASHRQIAFRVCAQLVDRIKERAPLWKEQHLAQGGTEWVNL